MGFIEKLKKPIELKGRVIRYKPVAKLNKKKVGGGFKKMRGGNFKIYTYWYTNMAEGRQFQHNLQQRFKGIYTKTPEIKLNTKFGKNMEEYTVVKRHNPEKEQDRKKEQSKTFKITDSGIMIADNFHDFDKIQTEIIPSEQILLSKHVLSLSSIVVHQGIHTGGHYTAYLKIKGNWYYYNDIGPSIKKIGNYRDLLSSSPSVTRHGTLHFYS